MARREKGTTVHTPQPWPKPPPSCRPQALKKKRTMEKEVIHQMRQLDFAKILDELENQEASDKQGTYSEYGKWLSGMRKWRDFGDQQRD